MNLIKRLRNLWLLSEWQPSNQQLEELVEVGRKFAPLTQPPRMATIIKRTTPVQDFLEKTKTNE